MHPEALNKKSYEGVKLLAIKEIAAMKAYTVGRRGSYKDYLDLYFIISENHGSLEDIIELAEKKHGKDFNARLFLEQLIYLDDIQDLEILFLRKKITKEDLKELFSEKIKELRL